MEMAGVVLTVSMFAFQMLSEMVPGSAFLEVCSGYWKNKSLFAQRIERLL